MSINAKYKRLWQYVTEDLVTALAGVTEEIEHPTKEELEAVGNAIRQVGTHLRRLGDEVDAVEFARRRRRKKAAAQGPCR